MTNRKTEYEVLTELIEAEASLHDLYDAMRRVQDKDMRQIDASPKRLGVLATRWTQRPRFLPIRLNELFGGLHVEHSDDYVLAMVGALGDRWHPGIREHLLRHDHSLREDVFWRIFEIEGGGEISLANVDKFSRPEAGWHAAVLTLAGDGTLDRARLLRSCLQALNRDFSAYRAGWFSRVYTALAPSAAEAAADQDLLRLTLGSTVTASVSLAARQLAAVHQAGLLDAAAFVAACGPALAGPKAAAMSVLKMLSAMTTKKQAADDAVARTLVLGTGHAHPDVQRAALAALFKLGRADLAQVNAGLLAPAVAAEWLPKEAVTPTSADAPPAFCPSPTPLPQAAPVRPWTNDDARERCAILLEEACDAIEFELMLAWLASADNPGAALAPLVKRAHKLVERREQGQHYPAGLLLAACVPGFEFFPRAHFERTMAVARAGETQSSIDGDPEPNFTEDELSPLPWLVTRLREVAALVQGRAPRRLLLATPTDSHGWIDPAAFRDRFAAYHGIAPFPADLTQALLRLRPEGRDAMLTRLKLTMPPVTRQIRIEWHSRESDEKRPSGVPLWVWWYPVVTPVPNHADKANEHSPAVIALQSGDERIGTSRIDPLTCAEIALIHPPSTLALVALCVGVMKDANWDTPNGAEHVLRALNRHPGAWSAETVQLVALGMAAKRAEVRAQAAELLAAAVPTRIDAASAAAGLAACAPAVALNRWASAFSDAARLAPATVIELLAALLPRLDPKARGLDGLLAVLLDEATRLRHLPASAALSTWLEQFSGASSAAKTARALRALSGKQS